MAAEVNQKKGDVGRRHARETAGLTDRPGLYSNQLFDGFSTQARHRLVVNITRDMQLFQPAHTLDLSTLLRDVAGVLSLNLNLLSDGWGEPARVPGHKLLDQLVGDVRPAEVLQNIGSITQRLQPSDDQHIVDLTRLEPRLPKARQFAVDGRLLSVTCR